MGNRRPLAFLLALAAASLAPAGVQAQAVISNGSVTLGVNEAGHLIVGGTGLKVGSYESVALGACLCEGWGVGLAGGTYDQVAHGFNFDDAGTLGYGSGPITTLSWVDSFTSTASTATSVVDVYAVTDWGDPWNNPILRITHDYKPSISSALFQVDVTIQNLTGETLGSGTDGLRYRRLMDWDIQPTEFTEYVTVYGNGTATNLLGTSNNGQTVALPFAARTSLGCGTFVDVDFTDAGPCDHGALFDFGFDALDPGASRSFKIFYGGVVGASAEADVINALSAVGAEVYSLGQCRPGVAGCDPNTGAPITMAYGFANVGGTPIPPYSTVPEPGTVLLMATGLLGLGVAARRRKTGPAA